MTTDHNHKECEHHQSWLFSRTGIATCVALVVSGFLIYEGHGVHLLGFLPYLLILSCPLMHIFMHGRHHHHHDEPSDEQKKTDTSKEEHKHSGGCH